MRRLLIRGGGIGDCIVSFPAMEALAVNCTEVWITPQCQPLISFASRTRSIAATGVQLLRFWGLAPGELKEALACFECVISWYGAQRAAIESALRLLHPNVWFLQAGPPADGGIHAVDFHNAQVRSRLPAGIMPAVDCSRVPKIDGIAWRGNGGFVAFQPFASALAKEWPFERFIELERIIRDRVTVKWLVPQSRLPLPVAPKGQIIITPDFRDLARVLESAVAYVGGDTGISHLAGAVGTPSVVIFGPMQPEVWAPRSYNHVVTLRRASGRTAEVSTEEVLDSLRSIL